MKVKEHCYNIINFKLHTLLYIGAMLFLPFMGKGQTDITIGSGSGTTDYFPLYYLYNYSYSQTIYTNSELAAAGATGSQFIYKIRYKPTSSASTSSWRDWVVYLGNTSKAGFSSSTDWEAVSSLTEVYNGQIQASVTANQWLEIVLDQPFLWDGTSNILVAVDQNTSSWGGSPNWAGYTGSVSSGSKGIYYYSDGTNPDPATPPSSTATTNSVAQIQFEMLPAEECSGQPSAGTPVPSTFGNCPDAAFSFSMSGTSVGQGMSYQWQVRPAGATTWNNLFATPTLNYPANAFNQDLEFRLYVTCDNSGLSDTSAVVLVTLNEPTECYCVPGGTSSSYYINRFVTTGGHSNITNVNSGFSPNGYGDFTNSFVAAQYRGQSINFSTTYSGGLFGTKIWVDWNQNGIFENSEVVYSTSAYAATASGSFTVPASALIGATRMRIGISYTPSTGPDDSCESGSREFEDYLFYVMGNEPCDGMPTAGAIIGPDLRIVCPNQPFNLMSKGMTVEDGISYQWQRRDAGGSWVNLPSPWGTQIALNHPGTFSGDAEFRLIVTCDNSGLADTTDAVRLTTFFVPGEDGVGYACRIDGTFDLNSVISTPYPGEGTWTYPGNNSKITQDSILLTTDMPSGEVEIYYIIDNGCIKDTTTATITVLDMSSAGEGGILTVCKNQPINLYESLQGNADFGGTWYDYNDQVIGSSQIAANHLSGNYNYKYVVGNDACPADTAIVEIIVDPSCDYYTGIDEEAFGNIGVYPNPAETIMNIEFSKPLVKMNIELTDINGRVVYSGEKKLDDATTEVDVSSLVPGVYLMRLFNQVGQRMFKIVKK